MKLYAKQGRARASERQRIQSLQRWMLIAVLTPLALELLAVVAKQWYSWGQTFDAVAGVAATTILIGATLVFVRVSGRLVSLSSMLLLAAVTALLLEAVLRAVSGFGLFPGHDLFTPDSAIQSDVLHLLELGTLLALFLGLFRALTDEKLATLDVEARGERVAQGLQRQIDAGIALRALAESTAASTGEDFFSTLAKSLAESLGVSHAIVGEFHPRRNGGEISSCAYWSEGALARNITYPIQGTPCERVVAGGVQFVASGVQQTFPDDADLVALGVDSYLGMPMYARDGSVMGHVAVLSTGPMEADPQREQVLRIFVDRAAAELERMRQHTRLLDQTHLIESAQDSIITADFEGRILSWNRGAEQIYGYTAHEMIGRSLGDLLPAHSDEFVREFQRNAREGVTADNAVVPRRRKDGATIWVSLSTFGVHDSDGKVVAYSGIARDVTAQVQQERLLRESESRLRLFFANVPDVITVIGTDGTINYSNRPAAGQTPGELRGRNVREFVPESYLTAVDALLEYVTTNQAAQTFEVPSVESGRTYRASVVPIVEGGKVREIMIISRDITESVEQEKALRESEHTLRGLFENVPDLIRVLKPDGTIVFANHTYWDAKPAELVGRNILEFVLPEEREEARARLERVVQLGEPVRSEQRGIKTGKIFLTRLVPVRTTGGVVDEILMVGTDVTEQRAQQDQLQRARDEYQFLAERMNDIIWQTDGEFRMRYVSPSVERITGYTVDEVMSRIPTFNTVPEDLEKVAALFTRAIEGNEDAAIFEYRALRKDGSEIVFEISAVARRDASGKLVGFQGVSRDITQRRAAERALRERDALQRVAFANVPDMIRVIKPDGTILFANHSNSGFSPEQLVGRNMLEFVPEERRQAALEGLERVARTGQPESEEWTGLNSGRYFQTRAVPIRGPGENAPVEEILMVATDITDQRAHEAALREAKDQYQFLAERMNDVVWRLDRELKFSFVSPSVERVTGYAVDEVLGQPWGFNVLPDHIPAVARVVEDALRGRTDEAVFDLPSLTKSGDEIVYEVSMVALRGEDGRFSGLQGIARDITERRKAENALREREALYRVIIETSHEGICLISQDNRIVFVNARMAEMLKYTPNEMVGRNVDSFIVDRFRRQGAEIMRRLRDESALNFEFLFRAKDESHVWTDVAASQVRGDGGEMRGIIGMVTDISERKRAEDEKRELEVQVQHAQKLESLGVLAGGIAHDFNNLLAGIMGYASLLSQDLGEADPRKAYVEKIELASNRAAELTKQMLAYSGKGKFVLEQLDLTRLTTEMLDLIHASISKKAETVFELADDLPPVRGDSSQISQVVMNLVINASDALEDRPGRITVRTKLVEATEGLLRRSIVHSDDARPGTYVMFETIDTGCGMDEETVKRIFDPFFTTKFTGRGLGLAAALGIVRGHHGAFIVESTAGKGSTMQVLFPVSGSPVAAEKQAGRTPARPRSELTGMALVADDDPMVLSLASEILERHGMQVIKAEDGEVALARFRANPMGFRVVVLDLTMPKLNGRDAFAAMRGLRSDIPIIISSGYAEREALEHIGEHTAMGFIQKPYRNAELIEKVKNVLEGASVHVAK